MKKGLLVFGLLGLMAALAGAQEVKKAPLVLEIGGGGHYSYKTDFEGAQWSYSGIAQVAYRIGPDSQLGITLLRFNGYPGSAGPLSTFSYGFNYRHYWPGSLAEGGPALYFSYSILLNQAAVSGTPGRGVGHDSRVGLGGEFPLGGGSKIYLEGVWDYVSFPSLGTTDEKRLQSVGAFLGYRLYL